MPIKAKQNGSYKYVTDLMNVDESIDYVLAKTSSSYKRVYTATRSIEDVPPTTFKSIKSGANLSNYRIYGQTVDGESVGERTANMFDKNDPSMIYSNSNISTDDKWAIYDGDGYVFRIPCKSNQTYTLSISYTTPLFRISTASHEDVPTMGHTVSATRITNTADVKEYTFTTSNTAKYILFQPGKYDIEMTINTLIVNEGSTALPYEPYGYKVPVTVSNGTDTQMTNVYLTEQIRKVGSVSDYVDYSEQKETLKTMFKNLTSNLTWSLQSINEYGIANFLITISNYQAADNTPIICNNFSKQTSSIATTKTEGIFISNGASRIYVYIRVKSTTASTVAEFKSWLDENPTYVLFQLAPSSYTDLDVTLPALPTVTGTNTLSVGTEVQPSKIDITGHIKTISGGS